MGATEEQIAFLSNAGVTHVSYILLIFSAAFLMFLFVNILLHVYAEAAIPIDTITPPPSTTQEGGIRLPPTPVDIRRQLHKERDLERVRAAEEFELEGLISQDDADGENVGGRDGASEDSGSGRRKERRIRS